MAVLWGHLGSDNYEVCCLVAKGRAAGMIAGRCLPAVLIGRPPRTGFSRKGVTTVIACTTGSRITGTVYPGSAWRDHSAASFDFVTET